MDNVKRVTAVALDAPAIPELTFGLKTVMMIERRKLECKRRRSSADEHALAWINETLLQGEDS